MKNIIVVAVIVLTLSACSPAKNTISVFHDYRLSETSEMPNSGKVEAKAMNYLLEKLILRAIINDPSPIPVE